MRNSQSSYSQVVTADVEIRSADADEEAALGGINIGRYRDDPDAPITDGLDGIPSTQFDSHFTIESLDDDDDVVVPRNYGNEAPSRSFEVEDCPLAPAAEVPSKSVSQRMRSMLAFSSSGRHNLLTLSSSSIEETRQCHRHRATAIPSAYICPLTLQLLQDPVHDGCGHVFERTAILDWLEVHEICPVSRKPCMMDELVPATRFQQRIQEWQHNNHINDNHILSPSLDDDPTILESCDHDGFEHTAAAEQPNKRQQQKYGENDTYSAVELMLLPQERKVLRVVRIRARNRMRLQRYQRVQHTILISVSILILITFYFVARYRFF